MNTPTVKVRELSWDLLMAKTQQNPYWAANQMIVMDKRLEDFEALHENLIAELKSIDDDTLPYRHRKRRPNGLPNIDGS